jgi:hypothetical protein
MNSFRKRFLGLLEEAPEDTIVAPENEAGAEQAAVADTMDQPEAANQLTIPDNPEIALKQQQTQRTIQTLTTWIGEVENFIDYLNGTDEGSINFALNSADCDSLMTDIQRSESKKISRLAQDLSSLGESLKQYLLLARRKESNSDSI